MRVWLLSEMRSKIQDDLNLTAEDFVSAAQLDRWIQEAIDIAEAEIHKFGRESYYFLKSAFLSIVSGTSTYSLPSDIYGNKIVRLIDIRSSNDFRLIPRFRGQDKFMSIEDARLNGSSSDDLAYQIIHTSATAGYQIEFYPTPQFTSSTRVKIWYIRNANEPAVASSDKIDIPEAMHFIMQYAKNQVKMKEFGDIPQSDKELLVSYLQSFTAGLVPMVEDDDNTVIQDNNIYREHS